MINLSLIKPKVKRVVKKSKQITNLFLLKAGFKFHSYGSMTDLDSREIIRKHIEPLIDAKGGNNLKVLIVGSPGMQELRSISPDYLKKIDVKSVDYSDPQTLHKLSTKLKVAKYNFVQSDAFSFLSSQADDTFDLIINRSFLHHISKNNKKIFVDQCSRILVKQGQLFCIDWFVNDYSDEEGMFQSIYNYYNYRSKYTPALKNKMTTKNRDKSSFWWNNMHADSDFSGGKHATRGEMKDNIEKAGFSENQIIDIADPKKIDDPYLWGHVFIIAKK